MLPQATIHVAVHMIAIENRRLVFFVSVAVLLGVTCQKQELTKACWEKLQGVA